MLRKPDNLQSAEPLGSNADLTPLYPYWPESVFLINADKLCQGKVIIYSQLLLSIFLVIFKSIFNHLQVIGSNNALIVNESI